MTEEAAFVAAILAAPYDDAPRLVFADWLEERGDPRGEWLRINVWLQRLLGQTPPVALAARLRRVREIAGLQRRFRELRAVISDEWALRLQRGPVEQCSVPDADCPGDWSQLPESGCPSRRMCGACRRWVTFCWSAADVHAALVAGQPVVKSPALDR
jgi:uncharacterized protein (TIGR02996 family)